MARGDRDTARADVPPITPASRDGELPLSFAQERLWFLDQLDPGNTSYNMPSAVRLRGPLDVEALEMGEVIDTFRSLGIGTLGALRSLPRAAIASRMRTRRPWPKRAGTTRHEARCR